MSEEHVSKQVSSQKTVRREVNISSRRAIDVPVQRLDFSILDSEFGSAQGKFNDEMARMDAEMEKLRSDFFGGADAMPSILPPPGMAPPAGMDVAMPPETKTAADGSSFTKTVTSKRTVTKTTTSTSGGEQQTSETSSSHRTETGGDGGGGAVSLLDSPDDVWKDFMTRNPSSPLIQQEQDGTSLRLRFDVHDYAPDDIEVKTVDHTLCVRAKHEQEAAGKSESREFSRQILLPSDVEPERLRSSLSKDGILTVQAPLAIETGPTVTSPPP